ncbi:MAG: anhydro-N-acetylmuramic acid kinase [Acidobacteriota bacterium]|nr:anhydro-N-acetylmuramic acid kinase [Acidobacteriota bacterium]
MPHRPSRVTGIMSGTSLDGIDVAIVDLRGSKVETVAHGTAPYSTAMRQEILAVTNTTTTTARISEVNFQLGELYAKAVIATCKRHKIPLDSISLIGCHGQTIYHGNGNTLQIGEAAVIAERTGITVVSDFRARDIAAGGQGAPLVPFMDYRLFRHPKRARIALNIGGIANLTAIPAGARPEDVIAFDTGPGNMVMDALVAEHTGGKRNFDRNGAIAASAPINRVLLDELLQDRYYRQKPPKSTGREKYGEEFIARLKQTKLPLPELIATATALTAASIALGIDRFVRFVPNRMEPRDLILSGGGAHNRRLIANLHAFLPDLKFATTQDFGINVDAKEAIAFAILAYETFERKPGNLPSATGARRPVILGKITVA